MCPSVKVWSLEDETLYVLYSCFSYIVKCVCSAECVVLVDIVGDIA